MKFSQANRRYLVDQALALFRPLIPVASNTAQLHNYPGPFHRSAHGV